MESSHTERGRTLAARGVLWLSVGSWGAKGAQTAVLLVLARALVPSQFGILAVAALTYNVLGAISQLGVADALTYLEDQIEEASRTAMTMVLVVGIALMGVTLVFAPAIASFFHNPSATFVLRGFALCLPFDTVSNIPIGRLTRAMSFSRRSLTDTLPSLFGAAVTIAVVESGHPLVGLVMGQIVSAVTNCVVAMLLGPVSIPGWNSVLASRILRYGGYLSGADLLNLGLLNVDYVIVGHVLGPVALGYYSLAYRICFMPYLSIAVVANGAAFPYYCRLPSHEAIARTTENVFSLIVAICIPWFAGLILFAKDLVLLGNRWAPAVDAVRFLAVYGFFLCVILSIIQILKAVGRSDLVLISRALHLVILAAVILGTVRGGITVVALDQALVACIIAVIVGAITVRKTPLMAGPPVRSVFRPVLGAIGMVPVVLLGFRIHSLRPAPSWISLLVLGPLSLVVFVGILWLLMREPLRAAWRALRGRSGNSVVTGDAAPSA